MIKIIVKGSPIALKRHRTVWRGNSPIQYDPSKSDKRDFLMLIQAKAPKSPFNGAIIMKATFYMPRPKNHYRTGKYAGILKDNAPVYHSKKPDFDNLIKFVCDAMNGVFYNDDAQICDCEIKKYYSVKPRTEIWIDKCTSKKVNE